jgi:uncharacterized protein (TIGR02145 family)
MIYKSTGKTLWLSPGTDAPKSSGFIGLPGGYLGSSVAFNGIGTNGAWWSSTQNDATGAWCSYLYYLNGLAYKYDYYKIYGFSVRCIKDL